MKRLVGTIFPGDASRNSLDEQSLSVRNRQAARRLDWDCARSTLRVGRRCLSRTRDDRWAVDAS